MKVVLVSLPVAYAETSLIVQASELMNKKPVEAAVLMEQMAQTSMSTSIDADTKKLLKNVTATFAATTNPFIIDAHDTQQKDYNAKLKAVNSCISEYEIVVKSDKATEAKVYAQGRQHKRSRILLKTIHDRIRIVNHENEEVKPGLCDEMDMYISKLHGPTICTKPEPGPKYTEYTTSLQDYFKSIDGVIQHHRQQWEKLDKKCEDQHVKRHDQAKVANGKQDAFERGWCKWKHDLWEHCADFESCYDGAYAAWWKVHKEALVDEQTRKIEWRSVQKVICYIDVIISTETNAQRQKALNKCKALAPDTSHLDFKYGKPKKYTPCDHSPVHDFPCKDTWLDAWYVG